MSHIQSKVNSISSIRESLRANRLQPQFPLLMLFLRLVLFAGWQVIFALTLLIFKVQNPWQESIKYWIFGVILANIVCWLIVTNQFHKESINYWQLISFAKGSIWKDSLTAIGLFIIAGPLGYFPNILFGSLLFGDAMVPAKMMFHTLPMVVAIIGGILFPLSQALIEIPTYFTYIMPRLEAITNSKWIAVGLASFFLAFQHIAIPLIFDLKFMVWRFVMFLPFAIYLGFVIRWKPRLLPYFLIGHFFMDLSTAIFIIPGLMP